MITKENQDHFIDRYLMGKLNLLELEYIEKKIKNDSEFEKEVSLKRIILLGIQQNKRIEIKNRLSKIDQSSKIINFYPVKNFIYKYRYVASFLLLFSIMVSLYSYITRPIQPTSRNGHFTINNYKTINKQIKNV